MFSRLRFTVLGRLAAIAGAILFGASLGPPSHAQQLDSPRVKHVSVLGAGEAIEVEIQTSAVIVPQSQTIVSPDRIIVDFPGALPAAELRAMAVNRGVLKAVRTGLFSANPPITRVVLDLSEPRAYQIFASGNRVMLKLGTSSTGSSATVLATTLVQPSSPAPKILVNFQHGLLRIHAKGATLAEVLFEVQRQTGADIPIPAGAEQEVIAADIGPAPAQNVLATLLNGSRYNFIFVDGTANHSLQKAILSVR